MPTGMKLNDSMVYSERGGLPWHGMGKPIGEIDLRNIGKVMAAAGLNWAVREFTPTITLPNGDIVELNVADVDESGNVTKNSGYRAFVRDDDWSVLSVMQGRYHTAQNSVLFDIADSLSTVDQAVAFETAGSLRGGRTVWALARMGADSRMDGLGFEDYLLVFTTHDGTSPTCVIHTKVRVVCSNTLAMARSKRPAFAIKHTASAADRIEEAKQAIARMVDTRDEVDEDILRLLDVEVTNDRFEEIVRSAQLFGDPDAAKSAKGKTQTENRLAVVRSSWNLADNAEIRGTGFGVVNAVNDAEIWASSIRGDQTQSEQQMRRIVENVQPLTRTARDLILN